MEYSVNSLQFSSIWLSCPSDLASRMKVCIDSAIDMAVSTGPGYVFFRADDVAVPGKKFVRLVELFTQYRVPLSLAVVPAWLTRPRWQHFKELGQKAQSLWCWHQHGWRHLNHEAEGKKEEFGQSRSLGGIREDLIRGRHRLGTLMEQDFYPIFTPPWNRCNGNTLSLLKELGYHAVSRSEGSLPPPPEGLTDFPVNVDLHTRKEVDPVAGWNRLFAEFRQSISSGFCGIMIHHQLMNDAAFVFLELLLQTLVHRKGLCLVHFKDLTS